MTRGLKTPAWMSLPDQGSADPFGGRLVIETGTSGVQVGVHPAELLGVAFNSVAWLKALNLFPTTDGRVLPVMVFDRVATSSPGTDTLEWGDEIDAVAAGAEFNDGDPNFSTSVKLLAHKRGWRTTVGNETIRDVEGFEDKLRERAGYGLALTLAARATTGATSASDGQGFVTNLTGSARTVTAAANTALTTADVWKLYSAVPASYRRSETCGFVADDSTIQRLAEASRGGGSLLDTDIGWREMYGAEGGMFGKPVWEAPGMPKFAANTVGVLGFGEWQCMGLRIVTGRGWTGDASRHKEFNKDATMFRFAMEYDTAVLDQEGLAILGTPA